MSKPKICPPNWLCTITAPGPTSSPARAAEGIPNRNAPHPAAATANARTKCLYFTKWPSFSLTFTDLILSRPDFAPTYLGSTFALDRLLSGIDVSHPLSASSGKSYQCLNRRECLRRSGCCIPENACMAVEERPFRAALAAKISAGFSPRRRSSPTHHTNSKSRWSCREPGWTKQASVLIPLECHSAVRTL
jgi:hypothetical protein